MAAHSNTSSDGFLWQTFLILAASAFAPFQAYSANTEAPSISTAISATLVLTGLGLLVRWILVRRHLDPLGSTYAVALFLVLVTNGGVFVDEFAGARWVAIAGVLVIAVLGYRLRELRIFQVLMTWGAFFLIAIPVVAEIGDQDSGGLTLQVDADLPPIALTSTPDVVVIVSDGYTSSAVMEEVFGIDNSAFDKKLSNLGFDVGEQIVSNYPMTLLSVGNTMSLDYAVEGGSLTRTDIEFLYETIGGNNSLSNALGDHGYSQTYVESGWLGTRCRSEVDTCVAGPWPDESIYDIAWKSVFRDFPGFEVGRSFTRGTVHSMSWLDTELEPLLRNDSPDYVYVHLLAPHPPHFLLPDCQSAPRADLSGFTSGTPWSTPEELDLMRTGYANQVQCVNSVLDKAAAVAAANDAVMVMFGDHGTDLAGQLYVNGADWTEAQKRERFGVHFAGYGPGCDFSDLGSLINVGRRILNCLGDNAVPDLATRSFIMTDGWHLQEIPALESLDG